MWLAAGGWLAILVPTVVIGFGVFFLGLPRTGDLLLGTTSPVVPDERWRESTISWLVALTGWLAVPALVGAITGYVVTVKLSSYRARTREDILNGPGLEHE